RESNKTPGNCSRDREVRMGLRRKVHAAQQILEAWVRAQVIQPRKQLGVDHPRGVFLISKIKPMKRLIFLVQRGVDCGWPVSRHVALFRDFVELIENFERVIPSSCGCITVSEQMDKERKPSTDPDQVFHLSDGSVVHPLLREDHGQSPSSQGKIRYQVKGPATTIDASVVTTCQT